MLARLKHMQGVHRKVFPLSDRGGYSARATDQTDSTQGVRFVLHFRKNDFLEVLCGSASRVHAPKLLPSISLSARARRRGLRRFFEGRFLRAKNHALGAGRTGPHLKEYFRKFMFS